MTETHSGPVTVADQGQQLAQGCCAAGCCEPGCCESCSDTTTSAECC